MGKHHFMRLLLVSAFLTQSVWAQDRSKPDDDYGWPFSRSSFEGAQISGRIVCDQAARCFVTGGPADNIPWLIDIRPIPRSELTDIAEHCRNDSGCAAHYQIQSGYPLPKVVRVTLDGR
jgi:hypothetical protein